MTKIFTKSEVSNLDFDSKCVLFERLLPDDYLSGQHKIGFCIDPDFKEENGEPLPQTPPEIVKAQMIKMEQLFVSLAEKLFLNREIVEFDFD
jgi:hypothetical protein